MNSQAQNIQIREQYENWDLKNALTNNLLLSESIEFENLQRVLYFWFETMYAASVRTILSRFQSQWRIHWRLIFGNVIRCSTKNWLRVSYFICFKFAPVFFYVFFSMYNVLNKLSEFIYFCISKNITWYTFAACFSNRQKPSVYP